MINLSDYFLEIFDLKSGKSVYRVKSELPSDSYDKFFRESILLKTSRQLS